MSSIGQQYTFWNLINDYKIIVPKIQRDYVQGRENKTVEKNREEFVRELIDSLVWNKPMSLNFVYGTIHGDEFIPIDGQQRLTTLFLLHLYVFAKKGNAEAIKKLLDQFSYQTRYTTNRFLKKLAKELPQMLEMARYDESLAKLIRISGWYVAPWDNDPNISSCIVMLDLIHEKCKGETISTEILKDDCPITFMWLQLDKSFGSDNQLYIRMNSRGKQLTDFENFKAELYEKVLKGDMYEKKEEIKEFKSKIDGDWYSMLWEAKVIKTEDKAKDRAQDIEERARLIDALMKRIIHWTIVGKVVKRAKSEGIEVTKLKQSKKEKLLTEDEFKKREHQDLLYQYCQPTHEQIDILRCDVDQYRTLMEKDDNVLCETFLCDLNKLLNFLWEIKEGGIFQFIANDILNISQGKKSVTFVIDSYAPRVLLYAITFFANNIKTDQQNKIACFKTFYRVILNLVSTTEIDSPSDFQKAVVAISDWDGDTENWLQKIDFKGAFREAQVKEEILKLDLIKEDKENNIDWESAIRNAENTDFDNDYKPRDYFRGQIGFLLYMANSPNGYDLGKFKYYSQAVKSIFDKETYWRDSKTDDPDKLNNRIDNLTSLLGEKTKKNSFDNLFHRAMLTQGNYWIGLKSSYIKTFFVYNESHNEYDWRGAFRESINREGKSCNSTWNVAVTCLQKLLDGFKSECKVDAFEFGQYREWLTNKVNNFNTETLAMENKKEEALCKLLIESPNCFKYIRNNYFVLWDNSDKEKYCLMRLKLNRKESTIEITDKIREQGQTP